MVTRILHSFYRSSFRRSSTTAFTRIPIRFLSFLPLAVVVLFTRRRLRTTWITTKREYGTIVVTHIRSPRVPGVGVTCGDFHTWQTVAKWESKSQLMEETSIVWSTESLFPDLHPTVVDTSHSRTLDASTCLRILLIPRSILFCLDTNRARPTFSSPSSPVALRRLPPLFFLAYSFSPLPRRPQLS